MSAPFEVGPNTRARESLARGAEKENVERTTLPKEKLNV
jgi:hypothetical protein